MACCSLWGHKQLDMTERLNWGMKTPTQNGLGEGKRGCGIRFSVFVTPTHLLVIFKTWKGSEM